MAQFRASIILASDDGQRRARCVKPLWYKSVAPGGVAGGMEGAGASGMEGAGASGMEGTCGAAQQTNFSQRSIVDTLREDQMRN
jgi:hypothetical protein